jgi:hypothetical protein
MSVDTNVYRLALLFLEDVEKPLRDTAANDLAQQIQDLIESFLEYDLVEMRKESA